MANLAKLMKQALSVQQDMERLQADLAQRTVEFATGGGVVKATARGDGTIQQIVIDPSVVDRAEVDLLQDMVLAAVNGALAAVKEMAAKEMGRLTAGLGIPGLPGMKL